MRLTSHLNVPTAGKRQSLYRVVADFAETCVFSKQSQLSLSCGPRCRGHPLSRTYGINLPSSFTYGSLERLRLFASPSCVRFGTVTALLPRSFSRTDFPSVRLEGSSRFGDYADGFAYPPLLSQEPASSSRMTGYPPSLLVQRSRWCRNVDLLPIDYAFRPRLRDRLTLGGMALPRKP